MVKQNEQELTELTPILLDKDFKVELEKYLKKYNNENYNFYKLEFILGILYRRN